MNGDEVLDDRTGAAVTIAIVGSASGGSLVGTSLVGFGLAPAENPFLLAAAGALTIVVATLLAGWYLPKERKRPTVTATEEGGEA